MSAPGGMQELKLPEGTFIAESKKPIPDVLRENSHDFKGCIRVYKQINGRINEGFILLEDGNVIASALTIVGITLYQINALERMMSLTDTVARVYSYSDGEIEQVIDDCPYSLIAARAEKKPPENSVAVPAEDGNKSPESPYESLLSSIVSLPCVMAAALVADGLPVYQHGNDVDFEHIAVATEDMIRAGTRIASELQLGTTEQIIMETPEYKVIIAPVSDMFLCVLARADANLGLVRLNIKNAQLSIKDV